MECSICYEEIKDCYDAIKCKHKFCKICLNTWLEQHNTCPMCRVNVVYVNSMKLKNINNKIIRDSLNTIRTTDLQKELITEVNNQYKKYIKNPAAHNKINVVTKNKKKNTNYNIFLNNHRKSGCTNVNELHVCNGVEPTLLFNKLLNLILKIGDTDTDSYSLLWLYFVLKEHNYNINKVFENWEY